MAHEQELVRHAAVGDEEAFRTLVARVLPRLRRWALARTGDADDADEAVQRTLIRMHGALDGYAGASSLSTWLYRILANATTDMRRERATRPAAGAGASGVPESMGAASPDPLRQLHAGRMAAAVRDFFDVLPPRQREVLEMVDHQGMRPTEVAEALEMNPVTVRANLFKARRAVRERILARYPELTEGYHE